MHFPAILRRVSPMPMGLTPGFLSRATTREERNSAIWTGFTCSVARTLINLANEAQRSVPTDLKCLETRILPQLSESMPEGPAEPLVSLAAHPTRLASIQLKRIGSGTSIGPTCVMSSSAGLGSGCLDWSSSRTELLTGRRREGFLFTHFRAAET